MTRSRLAVGASMTVVVLGAVAGMGAYYLDPARAAVGPLPAEALALPSNTSFLMGFDVRRFVDSPFYRRYAEQQASARPRAFAELEERTGLDPERDVDSLIVAGREVGGRDAGVVLVRGRFDRYKLGRAIEGERKVTTKNHHGTAVYLFAEGKRGAGAVAFLDDDSLALGSQAGVEALIEGRAQGATPLRSNRALLELVEGVRPGATFWAAGDQSVLARMPRGIPGPGAAGGMSLPPLKSVVVTGDLDPEVALEIVGQASDAGAAQSLADVVRGLVALATLQAGQRPELKGLATAVSVTTDDTRVRVNARLPYEVLDALQPRRAPTASAEPRPAPRTR